MILIIILNQIISLPLRVSILVIQLINIISILTMEIIGKNRTNNRFWKALELSSHELTSSQLHLLSEIYRL